MAGQMTRWGIGPRFSALSWLIAAPFVAANGLWRPTFLIGGVSRWVLFAAGSLLIALGLTLYLSALAAMRRAFRKCVMVTGGVYSLCRHPLYASWLLFIVPGALLFFRSWLLLGIPPLMYVVFRLLIRAEDRWLEERFGQAYCDYRDRVNALFPVTRFLTRRGS